MPARQLLQSYLDEVGRATLVGDWDTYVTCVSLPFHLITENASMVIATEAELRLGFDQFHAMLKSQHVTDFVRLVESATEIGDRLISGRYVSHYLAGATRVVPPFRSQITLRQDGNRWLGASITNSLANARWPILVPRVADTATMTGEST